MRYLNLIKIFYYSLQVKTCKKWQYKINSKTSPQLLTTK